MNKAALLIANDPLTERVGSLLLREAGLEVVTGGFGSRVIEGIRERGFDLYVIYASECKNDWLQMCQALRCEVLNPILVVAADATEASALQAYAAGVDDVISMPLTAPVFLAKVKAWLRRSWAVPVETLQTVEVGPYKLDPTRREFVGNGSIAVRLTHLEFRVLYLLMTFSGRSLSSDLIIERVWGCEQPADAGSLKNVIYRLRRKIETKPAQPALVLTLPGEGYSFRPL